MASLAEEHSIQLKNRSRTPSTAYHAAGLAGLASITIGLPAIKEGEWFALFFPGVALFAFALAKVSELTGSKDFAILYPDRIEIPESRSSQRIVHWDRVTELRWLGAQSDSPQLRIYTDEFKTLLGFFQMDFGDLIAQDRLTFIRYVRKAARGVEQRNWPRFCRSIAIPLHERMERQRTHENQVNSEPLLLREKFVTRGLELIGAHPFFAALFMPVTFLFILSLFVSRRTCWIVAVMIAASSFINIRLFWGQWLEPFATICLVTAAVFFLLGLFALSKKPEPDPSRLITTAIAFTCFVLVLIGVPLFANIMAKGWIPNNLDKPLVLLALALLIAPVLIFRVKEARHEKHTKDQSEKEALNRWEAFEQQISAGKLSSD